MLTRIRSLLVANRGEIAIRVMRAASELGIRTIAIYSQEDRFSLHRTKADEAYLVGRGKAPGGRLPRHRGHPAHRGRGEGRRHPSRLRFPVREPRIRRGLQSRGRDLRRPDARHHAHAGQQGGGAQSRHFGRRAGDAGDAAAAADIETCKKQAAEVGYPVMLKASWGGGGRGMRVIESDAQLTELLPVARREAKAGFGNDEVYLEKLVRKARHIEVQILGDTHGNLVHLFERDCTVQRRNQKVVERAPAAFLTTAQRNELCGYALQDRQGGQLPQCRHRGIPAGRRDRQVLLHRGEPAHPGGAHGHRGGHRHRPGEGADPHRRRREDRRRGQRRAGAEATSTCTSHALQCRVTTEDPENNFAPDYGKITAYRSPAGFGIRLDAGTAYAGAILTRSYDSMLVKVTAWAPSPQEAIARMHRALWEFRIRGVATNLRFLDQVITHPEVRERRVHHQVHRRDARAVQVGEEARPRHAHPLVHRRRHRQWQPGSEGPPQAQADGAGAPAQGQRGQGAAAGHQAEARRARRRGVRASGWWTQKRVLITDTTMRDAHQSLLATRMRQQDMTAIAPYYAHMMPQLFSMECWGGATFDVAMRFLKEDPWSRLEQFRAAMPNLLLQMLLRSANAVGYTNYPDNVVRAFVKQAAISGIDLFRVFDSLNWVENMRVAIDAVRETGKLCEAAICYTGNLHSPKETKYTLDYYLEMGRELKDAGTHILGIKDMAGLCQPSAAYTLVKSLKDELGLPGAFPHARHLGHRGGERARGGGRGLRRRRRRHRCHEWLHVAAESRLHRRSAALQPARSRHRPRRRARHLDVLGAGAQELPRLRERHALGRVRGVRARHAGRAVHQSQGAGALGRASTIRAGPKWRRPMPTSTRCSATS